MPKSSDGQSNASTALLLVNNDGNPDASFDESEFSDKWTRIDAPVDWSPASGLPSNVQNPRAILVFSRKYDEKEALDLCQSIRDCKDFDDIPLIAAISMYQMPLGNDVKRLPNADMIFSPVKEVELKQSLAELESNSVQQDGKEA